MTNTATNAFKQKLKELNQKRETERLAALEAERARLARKTKFQVDADAVTDAIDELQRISRVRLYFHDEDVTGGRCFYNDKQEYFHVVLLGTENSINLLIHCTATDGMQYQMGNDWFRTLDDLLTAIGEHAAEIAMEANEPPVLEFPKAA